MGILLFRASHLRKENIMKFNAKVSMSEFGFASSAQAPAFEAGHEFMQYVAPKKDYFFRQELLRPLMMVAVLVGAMTLSTASLSPILAIIAGIVILIYPRILNYVVAFYLIISGLIGLGVVNM